MPPIAVIQDGIERERVVWQADSVQPFGGDTTAVSLRSPYWPNQKPVRASGPKPRGRGDAGVSGAITVRFLENGPSIPDELLIARDEGRVIFFCGAGISHARARLPDFFELAERVMKGLGAAIDSPARKLVAAAGTMEPIAGVTGVISADRVFSLLEREFTVKEVREALKKSMAMAPTAWKARQSITGDPRAARGSAAQRYWGRSVASMSPAAQARGTLSLRAAQ